MNLDLYNVIASLQLFFREELGIRVDWIEDGYEYPTEKPFMTIEVLPDEREILVKQREAVSVIQHVQIGYHGEYMYDRTKMSDKISDLLTFKRVPYYNLEISVDEPVGSFLCELTAVVPMMADETNRKSEYNRVYFDVEIENIKRGC